MAGATIRCPHCHKTIELTESLAAPLVEKARQEFEQAGREREAALAKRESALGRAFDMPTSELVLPIWRLIAAKKVRTRGERRAAKSFHTRTR